MDAARTVQYLRELKASGISEAQAEAQVIALENALHGLATKEELKAEMQSIRGEIAGIRGEIAGIKGEIAGIKTTINVLITLNVSTFLMMLTLLVNSVKHLW